MNSPDCPQFGDCLPDTIYRLRPGAYALIFRGDGCLAVMRTPLGHYLPGGGIERDEDDLTALHRELLEECGWQIRIGDYLAEAMQYTRSPAGNGYAKASRFYKAEFIAEIADPTEPDHEVRWLSVREAVQELKLESQRWVVEQMR